jgi:predicted nuclease of restriction endonuclease-like RecB superfamily
LAQSPLLYSSRLDAEVSDSDPAKLRRLFKYLKFFRLLAKISLLDDDSKGVEGSEVEARRFALRVDGPASIFESSNKYGLSASQLLPALIQVSEWKIDCEVKMRERVLRLKLDQTSGLVSHYSNFGAYIPEEASMSTKPSRRRCPTAYQRRDAFPADGRTGFDLPRL